MTAENITQAISEKEVLFNQRYDVKVHSGSIAISDKYRDAAVALYDETFTPIIPHKYKGSPNFSYITWDILEIEDRLENPDTTIITLEDKHSGKLVGLTYAFRANTNYNSKYVKKEIHDLDLSLEEYQARQDKTAEVGFTMIKPEHRAQGGWTHMMDALETTLKASGKYEEMIRIVRQDDHYAEKLRNRYKARIIIEIPDQPSVYGLQTYFRIKL